jgi:hypothetical protein
MIVTACPGEQHHALFGAAGSAAVSYPLPPLVRGQRPRRRMLWQIAWLLRAFTFPIDGYPARVPAAIDRRGGKLDVEQGFAGCPTEPVRTRPKESTCPSPR